VLVLISISDSSPLLVRRLNISLRVPARGVLGVLSPPMLRVGRGGDLPGALPLLFDLVGAVPLLFDLVGALPPLLDLPGALPVLLDLTGAVPLLFDLVGAARR
jgi:hypothetical protein